jgi:acyl-CoA reductase-like NAD-dependent aldehyde dehydrogenase
MSIAQEEIFDPVLSVLPFSGDEEAAKIAIDHLEADEEQEEPGENDVGG